MPGGEPVTESAIRELNKTLPFNEQFFPCANHRVPHPSRLQSTRTTNSNITLDSAMSANPKVDVNQWPRVEMTPTMMTTYGAMKGRDIDAEHDVVGSALYENKERRPDDARVFLPRFSANQTIQPGDGKSYYWDRLVDTNTAGQRKSEQMATSQGSVRGQWIGPKDQSFAEHMRLNPPGKKAKDYGGEYALAQAGYLLVNGKWVDPDSEQELSQAFKNEIIERYETGDDHIRQETKKENAKKAASEKGRKQSRRDPKINSSDPRPSYEPCEYGDNGLPPYTKYPIINGKLLTPEHETKMYDDFNDFVSDEEGDPRDSPISPAQFSQMALGSNFPTDYAVPIVTPPEPSIDERNWKISTGNNPRKPQSKRKPQFDIETSSTMTGQYSVPSSPSLVLEGQGVNPIPQPYNFSRMNPRAALDLDRQAYAPALYDQHQKHITSSVGESSPDTYTSEEGKEFMAYPGFPETGEAEYMSTKKKMEVLDYNTYMSNEQNLQLHDQLNNANLHRNEMQYQQNLAADHKDEHKGKGKEVDRSPDVPNHESEFEVDIEAALNAEALTKNQKKNAGRRKREYKRHVAEAMANKTIEAAKQKAVTEYLKEDLRNVMEDIRQMELCKLALENGTWSDGTEPRSQVETVKEVRSVDRYLRDFHEDRLKLAEKMRLAMMEDLAMGGVL